MRSPEIRPKVSCLATHPELIYFARGPWLNGKYQNIKVPSTDQIMDSAMIGIMLKSDAIRYDRTLGL